MEKVLVLMSTYNGEKYLQEQINSLLGQEGVQISIIVRDDGSKDKTNTILDKEQSAGHLSWYQGENKGASQSFMELLSRAPEFDYYALCDQDDVWLSDKLLSAVKLMKRVGAELYYSSYTTVDANLNIITNDVQHHHKDSLGAALVNLEVTGCTAVFTKKLLKAIQRYQPQNIMMHDSWIYKVALSLGYKVIYDPQAHIYYRQHGNNVIGDKSGFVKKMKSRYHRWVKNVSNDRYNEVKELYDGYHEQMPKENAKIVSYLINYQNKNFFRRLIIALKSYYRTGSCLIDAKFVISVLMKRY